MVGLTGCGGGAKRADSSRSAPAPPSVSTPAASTAPSTPATTPGRKTPAPPARTESGSAPSRSPAEPPDSSPEARQPIRVPVRFVLAGGKLRPPTVSVPAFIAIELTIVSEEPSPRQAVLATRPPRKLSLPGRSRATILLKGVPRGAYRLTVTGGGAATLVVGSEPGP